jgi:glycosyltransferase involved in cell wall biosynthesis
MAAALPVIAGANSAQTEILGDAALFVDPQQPGEIAQAIVKIASDPNLRSEHGGKGREQAMRFNWTKAARKTASYLTESVVRKQRGQFRTERPMAVTATRALEPEYA